MAFRFRGFGFGGYAFGFLFTPFEFSKRHMVGFKIALSFALRRCWLGSRGADLELWRIQNGWKPGRLHL